jgi:hypothetical protein
LQSLSDGKIRLQTPTFCEGLAKMV